MEPYITYSPIIERPPLRWPNGARVALLVIPNVEFYEYMPPKNPHKNAYSQVPAHPDLVSYAHRDYGNRIGFWRLLEVLDRHQVRATVSLNVAVLDHFPEICDAMMQRDWAFMSHGIYNTQYLYGMDEAAEIEFYQDTIDTLRRHTGRELKGMLGPGFTASPNTPRLMAAAGLTYSMDWFVDDQPFPINVPEGRLIGIPYSREINDSYMFPAHPWYGAEGDEFVRACRDQFDILYAEGEESGRVMTIALHPYLIAQPHRLSYLDQALHYIVSHPGVWLTTADDIADYYLAHYYDDVVSHLRGGLPG